MGESRSDGARDAGQYPPAQSTRAGHGGRTATVNAVNADGSEISFTAVVRVDTPQEVEYYRNGGILPYVLRQLAVG